jgi:hypothetical protein
MDKPTRKLELHKETLRTLNDDELGLVVGGVASNGLVCVDSVICRSGVCNSAVCDSGALCQSAVCNSGAICQSGAIC